MTGSLNSLMRCGGTWPPATRLALYRTFCRPIGDYGGALVWHWLASDPDGARYLHPAMVAYEALHQRAVCWIVGVKARDHWIAGSMTGLLEPGARLEHLALSLALHLERADPENPVHRVLDPSEPDGHSSSPLIASIRATPILAEYREHNAALEAAGGEAVGLTAWLRLLRADALRAPARGRMSRAIALGPHRTPSLVDRVLLVPDARRRRLAILWRTNLFRVPRPCVCGDPFKRGHVYHLVAELGLHSAEG